MTPRPPSFAMAMAIRCSVTVSMAAEMKGRFREMFRLNWETVEASPGRKSA